jgi:DNA-binding NarL/FixJ family response regulator
MIKIAITDDHPLMVEGIRNILSGTVHIQVVATFGDAGQTLGSNKLQEADVLLLDINLPDMDGVKLCKEVLQKFPHLKVIGLTSHGETAFLKNMIKAGASGYLLKSAPAGEIVRAITSVCRGVEFIQQEMKDLLLAESFHQSRATTTTPKLTRREQEILLLIADELTTQQIAEKLFLSNKTVETHRQNLMLKLGVKNSVGLIKVAMENGLVS